MKFDQTLNTCLKANLKAGTIPMLLGEPGIGKSSYLQDLAKQLNTKCFTLACNQLGDRVDLTGARMVPKETSSGDPDYMQVFFPHVVISEAIQYAQDNPNETPILFLDELNRTTPDITSALLSIPTLRSIGNRQLPDNLRVVIAGNDKGNITALDEASISRFVKYNVEPDTQTFLTIHEDLNPFIKNVLSADPNLIFCKNNQNEILFADKQEDGDSDQSDAYVDSLDDIFNDQQMEQLTTPRTIYALSNWLNCFDNDELLSMLTLNAEISPLQEVIEGHVGRTRFSAALLEEFINKLTTLPNQTPDTAPGKPAVYDKIKNAPNMDRLNEILDSLSENDLAGTLLYALYEKENNEIYINAINANIKQKFDSGQDFNLNPDHMKTLMKFASNDKLNRYNVDIFLNGDNPLSKNLAIILDL